MTFEKDMTEQTNLAVTGTHATFMKLNPNGMHSRAEANFSLLVLMPLHM